MIGLIIVIVLVLILGYLVYRKRDGFFGEENSYDGALSIGHLSNGIPTLFTPLGMKYNDENIYNISAKTLNDPGSWYEPSTDSTIENKWPMSKYKEYSSQPFDDFYQFKYDDIIPFKKFLKGYWQSIGGKPKGADSDDIYYQQCKFQKHHLGRSRCMDGELALVSKY
jgi:hypothetical protein